MAAVRAESAADPFVCHGATRTGYHLFDADRDTCANDGCTITCAELGVS